jgi:histone H3/H4
MESVVEVIDVQVGPVTNSTASFEDVVATTAAVAGGPLPLAPSQVDQVVKRAVPQGYHVAKDAKAAINKSANVFVLYLEALISSEKISNLPNKRQQPKRVTVSAADVKKALEDAGMAHLLPQMTANKRPR